MIIYAKRKGTVVPVLVDDNDAPHLAAYQWFVAGDGYVIRYDNNSVIRMHRQILHETSASHVVDHIDGNRCNNQRSNLRAATRQQNAQNTRSKRQYAGKTRPSQYKGVSYRRGKWRMVITTSAGQRIDLIFNTELEAALAYDSMAKKYHGCYARLNFGDETNP